MHEQGATLQFSKDVLHSMYVCVHEKDETLRTNKE